MMHLFDFLRRMLPANFTTESTENTGKKQSKGRDGSPSRPKKKPAAKKSSAVASKKKPSRKVK